MRLREREAFMHVYDFASWQNDGTWLGSRFRAADDDQAVQHALNIRTAQWCELRRDDFLLATFDGLEASQAAEAPLVLVH